MHDARVTLAASPLNLDLAPNSVDEDRRQPAPVTTLNVQSHISAGRAMTKRSHDIATSSHAGHSDRQASDDVEGNGSQDDANGSALKRPRSFMATLVSVPSLSIPARVLT